MKPFLQYSLQITDPNHHLGQLLGERVDFDAEELRGAHVRQPAQAELRAERDHLLFQVEQQVDGDVEEVAGAAGGVEDFDFSQAVEVIEQDFVEGFAGASGLRLSRLRAAFCTSGHFSWHCALTASHSRRSGAITTGSSSVRMSSRLV